MSASDALRPDELDLSMPPVPDVEELLHLLGFDHASTHHESDSDTFELACHLSD
jgi:hypothetical protein